jgi:hypothetical protein
MNYTIEDWQADQYNEMRDEAEKDAQNEND